VTVKRNSADQISEVVVTKVLNAPRPMVFKAWTDPKHVAQWWGPHQFTNRIRKWEARPDGVIDLDMIGPDGTAYPMNGMFTALNEPDSLTFTSSIPGPTGKPVFEVLTTVSFTESGGKTTVTMHAHITGQTDAAEQYLIGMEAGWTQSFEKLDSFFSRTGENPK
jgi:uncharacterized protein YndB with AHSA1/START domain